MPLLSSISLPSLTPEVVKSLCSISVKTVEELLFADRGTVAFRAGLNQEVVSVVISDLQKLYTQAPILGSNLYWDYIYNACIIPTSCPGMDKILDGGLWGGEMTEIVGPPSSGKTQFCMFAALNTAKQNKSVLYIDSANSFSPQRVTEMQQNSPSQGNETNDIILLLNRINCHKCFDAFALMDILYDLQEKLKTKDLPFYYGLKLVVIDSLGALLAPTLGGKQALGHSLMSNTARLIKSIAAEHHIAFLVTNYVVTADADDPRKKHKAALGMSWTNTPNTQVTIQYDPTKETRRAVLTKSAHMAINVGTPFKIDAQGISTK